MSDKLHDSDEEIVLSTPKMTSSAPVSAPAEKTPDQEDEEFKIKLKSPTLPSAADEPEVVPADESSAAASDIEIKLAAPTPAAAPEPVSVEDIKLTESTAETGNSEKSKEKADDKASSPSLFADVEVNIKKTEKDIPVRAILLPDLPENNKKSSKKWIFLVIILALLAGGCYIFFMQRAWFDSAVKQVKSWCGASGTTSKSFSRKYHKRKFSKKRRKVKRRSGRPNSRNCSRGGLLSQIDDLDAVAGSGRNLDVGGGRNMMSNRYRNRGRKYNNPAGRKHKKISTEEALTAAFRPEKYLEQTYR